MASRQRWLARTIFNIGYNLTDIVSHLPYLLSGALLALPVLGLGVAAGKGWVGHKGELDLGWQLVFFLVAASIAVAGFVVRRVEFRKRAAYILPSCILHRCTRRNGPPSTTAQRCRDLNGHAQMVWDLNIELRGHSGVT